MKKQKHELHIEPRQTGKSIKCFNRFLESENGSSPSVPIMIVMNHKNKKRFRSDFNYSGTSILTIYEFIKCVEDGIFKIGNHKFTPRSVNDLYFDEYFFIFDKLKTLECDKFIKVVNFMFSCDIFAIGSPFKQYKQKYIDVIKYFIINKHLQNNIKDLCNLFGKYDAYDIERETYNILFHDTTIIKSHYNKIENLKNYMGQKQYEIEYEAKYIE